MTHLRQLFKRPFLYLPLAIIGVLVMADLGISSVPSGSEDFATIPDVSVDTLASRVVPRQIASGTDRGSKITIGNSGVPQVLDGVHQTFGPGFYVTQDGVDVTTNTDLSKFIFNSNQNMLKIVKTDTATIPAGAASAGAGAVVITQTGSIDTGIIPAVAGVANVFAAYVQISGSTFQMPYVNDLGQLILQSYRGSTFIGANGHIYFNALCRNYDTITTPAATIRYYIFAETAI